jgi:hypothetical protein
MSPSHPRSHEDPNGDGGLPPEAEDHLFDPRAPVDPQVERLERLLAPLAFDPARTPLGPRAAPVAGGVERGWIAAVAAVAVVAVGGALLLRGGPRTGGLTERQPQASGPALIATGTSEPLRERAWIETQGTARDLRLGDVGRLTLGAGSRLEVRRLSADETRLYLERGRLDAFVSADAHPRFFQVDTPATRCVDLGCQYTLVVDDAGDAHVEVQTGQVAFENEGREVYVPAGARCRAQRRGGAGTPVFGDAPDALVAALERFDAARWASSPPAERLERARALLDAVTTERDALVAWHLLQDDDPAVAQRAHARLHALVGEAPLGVSPAELVPVSADRRLWRAALEHAW